MGGKFWLGKFVRGAYFDDPTNFHVVGGRNTYDQSWKFKFIRDLNYYLLTFYINWGPFFKDF